MKQKSITKLVALGLIATSISMGSNLGEVAAFAATKDVNSNNSFTVQVQGETVNMKVDRLDEDNVKVTSVTSKGETHEVTYNRNNDFMIMDGKKVSVKLTTEVDKSKVNLKINGDMLSSSLAADPYSPVYMLTNKVTFADAVATVAGIVTLAGAAITFSIVAFSTAALKTAVEKALAAAGVSLLGASMYFDGYIKYDQYRTSGQFSTSSGYQYMYRTQNYKFGGRIGNKSLSQTTISGGPGNWYYASRPY